MPDKNKGKNKGKKEDKKPDNKPAEAPGRAPKAPGKAPEAPGRDYKSTLNLPATDFQMKAELVRREPELLRRWEAGGLYKKIVGAGKGRPRYTLHDGPPYANGNIHMGHALNKVLKDIVVKSRFMAGFATDYLPGWDCHGLPIELQVEKNIEKEWKGKKEAPSKTEVRRLCREYAARYVDVQREEFKRLGVFGLWETPYLTMDSSYQSAIMRELGSFVRKGLVYKGKKPVHWCASCRTALAEAEVEYQDKTSPSVFVKFRVVDDKGRFKADSKKGISLVIWTTTPWTLPANLAIAVHPELIYLHLKTPVGDLIVNRDLVEACMEKFGFADGECEVTSGAWTGSELEGIVCEHPFIERTSPVLTADFVTTEAGTGCVHIAPGHGHDDYALGLSNGLDVYAPVDNRGCFTSEVPEFEGQFVFKANKGIIELLKEKDALIAEAPLTHSYPHCWRCKKPVIFRATAQWFVPMDKSDNGELGDKKGEDKGGLRKDALAEIDKVRWIPSWGRERIYGMIEARPDWCLSRQRAWGVPIPALTCIGCNESFLDAKLIDRLAELFTTDGADVWFEKDLGELLPKGGVNCPKCKGTDFEKEEDILDVWFDSGVSFASVLEKNEGLSDVAELYLEGSDQHRGWFHSALLASVATRGRAPYKAVLTHGFVVDGKGKKMSKSQGNVMAPQEVIDRYGAEVLRLWVASEDYREDIRISEEILKRLSEAYRRIRNTMRFMLGNISGFDPAVDSVDYKDLTDLDRFALHRLTLLTQRVRRAYEDFDFHVIYHSVHNFCSVDLSAFYLDVIKDRLYTSKRDSGVRRAAQTVMYHTLDHLIRLLAPVLVFTTDEAWAFMPGGGPGEREESVHLAGMPEPKKEWLLDNKSVEDWEDILKVKDSISVVLEEARKEKVIGHSLDAKVGLYFSPQMEDEIVKKELEKDFHARDLPALIKENLDVIKDILIISQIEELDEEPQTGVIQKGIYGVTVRVTKADGGKCKRCWKYSTAVDPTKEDSEVCERCTGATS